MSKLIQLRQRIKAIETIKKITHAMRLIAMSSHSHLKHKQESLAFYRSAIDQLFSQLYINTPDWYNPLIHHKQNSTPLIILVGSQKGLCGSFNGNLFKAFEVYRSNHPAENYDFIAVGQKAIDFVSEHHVGNLKHSYEKFTVQRLSTIAHEITHSIIHAQHPHHSIIIMSNISKSFFSQRPITTTLIPLTQTIPTQKTMTDYLWEQNPTQLLDGMLPQYLEAHIYHALFESLIAEHAARFLSMDTATRNANELLVTTRLEFNKQRQAKITKELTELSGSY